MLFDGGAQARQLRLSQEGTPEPPKANQLLVCERLSWSTISVPAARAAGLSTPSGVETVTSSCVSPWPNLSVRSWLALADSDVGS